jgi:hypothetical protein
MVPAKNVGTRKVAAAHRKRSRATFDPARQRRDPENDKRVSPALGFRSRAGFWKAELRPIGLANSCHFGSSPKAILVHPENVYIVTELELIR